MTENITEEITEEASVSATADQFMTNAAVLVTDPTGDQAGEQSDNERQTFKRRRQSPSRYYSGGHGDDFSGDDHRRSVGLSPRRPIHDNRRSFGDRPYRGDQAGEQSDNERHTFKRRWTSPSRNYSGGHGDDFSGDDHSDPYTPQKPYYPEVHRIDFNPSEQSSAPYNKTQTGGTHWDDPPYMSHPRGYDRGYIDNHSAPYSPHRQNPDSYYDREHYRGDHRRSVGLSHSRPIHDNRRSFGDRPYRGDNHRKRRRSPRKCESHIEYPPGGPRDNSNTTINNFVVVNNFFGVGTTPQKIVTRDLKRKKRKPAKKRKPPSHQ